MSLKFVIGRAGSGKTYSCLKEIAAKEDFLNNHKIYYIVPEQYTLQAERDMLSFVDTKTIMSINVLSFNRLSHNVLSIMGELYKTHIDDIGKALILKKIVSDNKEKFMYFKNCCSKRGFVQQLSDIITEFFKFNVSIDSLLEACNKSDDTVTKYKLNDLSIIYSEFLKQGYVYSESMLDTLYYSIDKSDFVKDAEIWIDGFFGFTPQEYKIIEKLISLSKNITITLTIGEAAVKNDNLKETSIFFDSKETYNKIVDIAHKLGISTYIKVCDNIKRFKNPALGKLESGLLTYSLPKSDNCEGIHIYEANSSFDEAENVCCQILSLVREKNINFNDIAVLSGDLESSINTLKNVFIQNKIPFFTDIKRPIAGFPLIELIMGLFNSIIMSMSYESVFSMLKTGLMPFDNTEVEILENFVLSHGIKNYKWKKQWTYKDIDCKIEGFDINFLRQRLMDTISLFSNNIIKTKKYSAKYISSCLYNFLELSEIIEKVQNISDSFEAGGELDKAYETRQCFNAFIEILDSISSIMPDEEMTLEEYRDIFESAVLAKNIGIVPPEANSVIIADTERSRLPEIEVLFVVNANEGVFPKNITQQGVFSETERQLMSLYGVKLSPDAKGAVFSQQFSVYSALTKPKSELYISYIKNETYKKPASPIVNRIKRLFPFVDVYSSKDVKNHILMLNSPNSAFHYVGEGLKNNDCLYSQIYEYFKNSPKWEKKANVIEKALNTDNKSMYLKYDTVDEFFKGSIYSSVSRLEKFASCPYMYFMTYTLKAKERPLYQINTPDLGALFHAVIENFSNKITEKGLDWNSVDNQTIQKLTNLCVKCEVEKFSNDIFSSSNKLKYTVKRVERISERAINTIIEHVKSGLFVPYAFELKFGSSGLAPIVIDLGDGRKMFLTGKIDRVDILDSEGKVYVKVIDYKSGSREFSLKDIYYGLQLQLMLYINAIIESGIFKGKTPVPGGVFYFKIKDPFIKSNENITDEDIKQLIQKELKMSGLVLMDENVIRAIDKEFKQKSDIIPISYNKSNDLSKYSSTVNEKTFLAIMKYCQQTAANIGREIIKGNISQLPYLNGNIYPCTYCQYGSVCHFERDSKKFRVLKAIKTDDLNSLFE